jgi:hypothetical protein
MVLDSCRIQAKWGMDPIPRRYQLKTVLLLERLSGEEDLLRQIDAQQKSLEETPQSAS